MDGPGEVPNMAYKNGSHTCGRCCTPPPSPLRPPVFLHPHRCEQQGGTARAHLSQLSRAPADRIRRRCAMSRDASPAHTKQVNACGNGTQMKASACVMAHAEAWKQQRWQTCAPLLRTLPNFRAMSSTAEAFQYGGFRGGPHMWRRT